MEFDSIRGRSTPPISHTDARSRGAVSATTALADAIGLALRAPSPRHKRQAPAAWLLATTFLFAGVVSAPARADSWIGNVSGDWFDGVNWFDGTVPTAIDNIDINAAAFSPRIIGGTAFAGEVTVGRNGIGSLFIGVGGILNSGRSRIGNDAGSLGSVTVDGAGSGWAINEILFVGNAGTGDLTVSNGAEFSTGAFTWIGGESAGQGTVTVDGAGSRWTSGGELVVGYGASGTLTVQGGGTVSNDSNGYVGGHVSSDAGSGTVLVDGAGSSWTNSGNLTVGANGTGTLTIQGGGFTSAAFGYIGLGVGGDGTVLVDGAGSGLTYGADLTVGVNGTGMLTIQGGGSASAAFGYIGLGVDGDGTVLVHGADSSLIYGADLSIGVAGTGALTIQDGGAVAAVNGILGYDVGSEGTLLVDGAGSSWTSSDLNVGFVGAGTLMARNGSAISTQNGYVGVFTGGLGTALIDGAGTSWTNNGELHIGYLGRGQLTIANGAAVSSIVGGIGTGTGATGTVLVDGAGSSWSNSDELYVGHTGTGQLTIANGGVVSSTDGFIGANIDGAGAALVDGAGSSWTNGGELSVGYLGAGQLTIGNGGAVSSGSGAIGTITGSNGTVLVDGVGSNWSNSGDLYVGRLGTGTLTVANDGAVNSAGQVVVAEEAGSAGTLNIGAAAGDPATAAGTFTAPSIAFGDGTGTLNFNHTSNDYVFAPALIGNGTVNVFAGTTIITGTGSNTGTTNVNGGTLRVEGSLGDTATTVFDTATLGGSGSIAGDVAVLDGGTLSPGSSAGTLTVGSLTLAEGAILDYELGQSGVIGGGVNDLIEIGGDLTLDGTLNVTDIGGFGAGVYRLMNYGGTLTDNTLELGALPTGGGTGDLFVQTAVGGQVNLVSSAGLTLTFWDGPAAGTHDNSAINGGDGTWVAGDRSWTQADGALNGHWDNGEFAVFGGADGTVTVIGEQAIAGLQFMSDYTLAPGAGGALDIGATATNIRVDPDVTATIAVVIGGGGGLVKQDTGTLVLTAANTYGGGTALLGGTVSVAQDANLGAAGGALDFDGGTLLNTAAFDTARTVTLGAEGGTLQTDADLGLDGTVSGAGMLTKDGVGTLTLTGDNAYTGGTRVLDGTLVGDVASIRGDLANDAMVVFDQAGDATFDGAINGSGAMVKRGSGMLTLGGASTLDWTIDAGALIARPTQFTGDSTIADGALLRFTEAGGSYAGTLSGAGRFEIAGGDTVFALAADSSSFAGGTWLESGMLRVDGSLGGLTHIASGATLMGTGTLGSVDSHGTVAAGNSIGTLTLSGDYIHRDDAILLAEIEPGGDSDLLDIAGSATIEGGTVGVIKAPGQYAGGTRYTLIDAAGGVTGTFDMLEQDLPFLDLLLGYDTNHVYLDVQRNDVDFGIVCREGSFNQCQVAGAFDRVAGQPAITPDLTDVLTEVTALTLDQVRAGFDRLSGEAHASLAGAMLEGHALYGQAVSRRIADRREAPGSDRLHGGTWVRGYGMGSDLAGDGNAHGADVDLHGLAAGVDAWVGESWLIGASVNALRVDADFRAGDGGEADAKNVALYTSVRGALAYFDGVASYAWWNSEVQRRIEVGALARGTRSEYGSHRFATYLEAGLNYELGSSTLQPLLSVEHSRLSTQDFREDGAGDVDLIGRSDSVKRTVAALGLRWTGGFGDGAWTFAPTAQVRWLHTFGDRYAEFNVAFAGAPDIGYRVRGATVPEDRGLFGVGLLAQRGDDLDVFVDVDYQTGEGFDAYGLGAGVRWRW